MTPKAVVVVFETINQSVQPSSQFVSLYRTFAEKTPPITKTDTTALLWQTRIMVSMEQKSKLAIISITNFIFIFTLKAIFICSGHIEQ